MSNEWMKWKNMAILLRDDGRVQMAKVKGNPLDLLHGESELVHRTEEGYLLFRRKGRSARNLFATAVIGRHVSNTVLICVEKEDAYGERKLDGMNAKQAKAWVARLKKIKKEALASATRKSR